MENKCLGIAPRNLEKCGFLKPAREYADQLLNLLQQPMASLLTNRHLDLIGKFVKASPYGLYLEDVSTVCGIVDLLINRLDSFQKYRPHLIEIIKLFSIPLLLKKNSDEIKYSEEFANYFTFLGYFIARLKDEELQLLILTAIIYTLYCPISPILESVQQSSTKLAIENSFLPEIIVHLMDIADKQLFPFLLKLGIIIANISAKCCEKMCTMGVINFVLVRLYSDWDNILIPDSEKDLEDLDYEIRSNYENISNFMWNLLLGLKHLPSENIQKLPPPNLHQIWCIRFVFRIFVLKKNYSKWRNDLMGIIVMIISIFNNKNIITSGLADDIAVLAVQSEIGTTENWAKSIKFLPTNTDLSFKKMLIVSTCFLLKHYAQIQIIVNRHVINGIIYLIDLDWRTSSVPWSEAQFKDLFLSAIRALSILVPAVPEKFIANNGFTKLLMAIEYYTLIPYSKEILYAIVKTFNAIIPSTNKYLLNYLRDRTTIDVLLGLIKYLFKNEPLNTVNQRILSYIFNILETIVTHHSNTLDNFGSQSINIVINIIKRSLQPCTQDMIIDAKMLMCLAGFLWEGIVWHPNHLKQFVNEGGVYLILDLIETSIFPVKLMFLCILVDLCEDGKCLSHLITWRGGKKKTITILSLLLSIFREDVRRLGVQVTLDGCIEDIDLPIMGDQQWYETYYLRKDPTSSPATVDMLCSCRPKIYAIIEMLRNRYSHKIDVANEHYNIYNQNLNTLDKVTMLVSENFLALKLAEIWMEVRRDLETASIKPLGVDGETIEMLTNRHRRWAQHLKDKQYEILNEQYHGDLVVEDDVYNSMMENKLNAALLAFKELERVTMTSQHEYRIRKKAAQNSQIARYFFQPKDAYTINVHRTFMVKPNITRVFKLNAVLESTKLLNQVEEIKEDLGEIFEDEIPIKVIRDEDPSSIFDDTHYKTIFF